MSALEMGSISDPNSTINFLYPVELTEDDLDDSHSLEEWELLGGQVSDQWVNHQLNQR